MDANSDEDLRSSSLAKRLLFSRISFILLAIHSFIILLICSSIHRSERLSDFFAKSSSIFIVSASVSLLCMIAAYFLQYNNTLRFIQYSLYAVCTLTLGLAICCIESRAGTDYITMLVSFIMVSTLGMVIYSFVAKIDLADTKAVFMSIILVINFNLWFVWTCFNPKEASRLLNVSIVSAVIEIYVGIVWLLVLLGKVHNLRYSDYAYPVLFLYSDIIGLAVAIAEMLCGPINKDAETSKKVEEANTEEIVKLKIEAVQE